MIHICTHMSHYTSCTCYVPYANSLPCLHMHVTYLMLSIHVYTYSCSISVMAVTAMLRWYTDVQYYCIVVYSYIFMRPCCCIMFIFFCYCILSSLRYWWWGLYSDISSYVATCQSCLERNRGHEPIVPPGVMPKPPGPFDMVSIDLMGPLKPDSVRGYKWI